MLTHCYNGESVGPALLDNGGATLASMTPPPVCVMLYLAAVAVGGNGTVVEFGTWAGGSSRCIAAGLRAGAVPSTAPTVLYAFDFFLAGGNWKNLNRTRFAQQAQRERSQMDLLPIWHEYVSTVYTHLQLRRGDIHELGSNPANWDQRPVDLFIDDSAKSGAEVSRDFVYVSPLLRVGSIAIFQDFFFCGRPKKVGDHCLLGNPGFVYSRLHPTYVRLLYQYGSIAAFGIIRAIPADVAAFTPQGAIGGGAKFSRSTVKQQVKAWQQQLTRHLSVAETRVKMCATIRADLQRVRAERAAAVRAPSGAAIQGAAPAVHEMDLDPTLGGACRVSLEGVTQGMLGTAKLQVG